MKPLNALIINTIHDKWEIHISRDFISKGIFNKVITQKKGRESKERFLSMGEKGLEGNYKHVPIEVYEKIYPHFPTFIDMYSRVSMHNSVNYNELNIHQLQHHFNLIINYYYALFIDNEIDILIQNNSPHTGYDLVPELVARAIGANTLYLEQSFFPNKFFYYWEMEDFGKFNTAQTLFEHEEIKLENKFEKKIPYMNNLNKGGLDFSKIRGIKSLNNQLHKNFKEYTLLKEFAKSSYRGQALYRYQMKKRYEKNQHLFNGNVDLNVPFVYFPLHLQPEKSTSSFGGYYTDQVLAIEHLSSILPKDWLIYVKENPKQTYFMRDNEFFKRILRIPNVRLVSRDVNTYDLLRNAKLAATITGTVAWESITGGKPAIIFGWGVWYESLPGIYKFNFDLDIEAISKEVVEFEAVQEGFNKIIAKTAPGIAFTEYYSTIYPEYDKEENIKLVTNSIEKIIRSKFQNI